MRRLRAVVAAAGLAAVLAGCAGTVSTVAPGRGAVSARAAVRAGGYVIERQPAPGSCHARGSGRFSLPDPRCTPGAVSGSVTPADVAVTICRRGYTRRVRPPESVTEPEKRASMAAYGDAGSPRGYEYDHLIPLELGGASNDPRNLWPEPGASPNPKDELEKELRLRVCAHRLGLAAAQAEIARDWVSAYHRIFG
jgi:hypothetical protein